MSDLTENTNKQDTFKQDTFKKSSKKHNTLAFHAYKARYGLLRYVIPVGPNKYVVGGVSRCNRGGPGWVDFEGGPMLSIDHEPFTVLCKPPFMKPTERITRIKGLDADTTKILILDNLDLDLPQGTPNTVSRDWVYWVLIYTQEDLERSFNL